MTPEARARRDERRQRRHAFRVAYKSACRTELCCLPPEGRRSRERPRARACPRIGTNYTFRGLWDFRLRASAGPAIARNGLREFRHDRARTEPQTGPVPLWVANRQPAYHPVNVR